MFLISTLHNKIIISADFGAKNFARFFRFTHCRKLRTSSLRAKTITRSPILTLQKLNFKAIWNKISSKFQAFLWEEWCIYHFSQILVQWIQYFKSNLSLKIVKSGILIIFPAIRHFNTMHCCGKLNAPKTNLPLNKCESVYQEYKLSSLNELFISWKHSNFSAVLTLSYEFLYSVLPDLYAKLIDANCVI